MASVLRRPDLGATFARGLAAVVRFPLPAACAFGFAVIFVVDQHDLAWMQTERPLTCLALGFFAALAGSLFAEQRSWSWVLRLLVSALPLGGVAAIVFLSPGQRDDLYVVHFLFLLPGLVLLVMVAPFLAPSHSNDAVWRFNQAAWFGAALGFASALLVAIAVMALFGAFDVLFGIEIDSDFYSDAWAICLGVLWPWIALSAMPDDFADPPPDYAPGWIRFIASTFLVPIASIYLVVLYIYGVSIILSWDLPRGNVANVVCGFAAVGVITHLICYPWRESGSRWLRGFHRYFYVLLFVPIALLAVAVGKRVGDYGVTEERYFLILAAVWLGAIAVYFSLRGRRLILVPVSLAVLSIAASFGTWGAAAVSERSQVHILHGLLTEAGLLREGRVIATDAGIDFELSKRIGSVVDYLANSDKHASIAPWFVGTNADFTTHGWPARDSILAALGLEYVSEWQTAHAFSFDGPDRTQIEIAGFDMLVERSLWRGIDDENVLLPTGRELTLSFDAHQSILTLTAEDGERVSFALAALARKLMDAGYVGLGGVKSEPMMELMTLDAADGPLRVRALVSRLWGEVETDAPENVAAEVILLIAYGPSGA